MWIQKAEIIDGEIKYNKLGKIKANEIEPGIADAFYVFEQSNASDEWLIEHNLGKEPSVSITSSTGISMFGFIEYIDINKVKISFKRAVAGIAYLN